MTTPDRINSTGQIVLESETLENNTASGNGYTRVFTGSLNLIKSQRAIELAAGATMVKAESESNGNYKLTAHYPYEVLNGSNAERPITQHELEVGFESVDVYSSDVMFAQLVAILGTSTGTYSAANAAKAVIENIVSGFKSASSYAEDPMAVMSKMAEAEGKITAAYSGSPAGILPLMLNLFRGIAYHGVSNTTQVSSTYRRRITAATYLQVQGAFTGVGQIWSSQDVALFEGIPSLGFFTLPANYIWFKGGPRVCTIAGQKTEVSYEYKSCLYAWSGNNVAYTGGSYPVTLLSF